jgi:hypothetical protein
MTCGFPIRMAGLALSSALLLLGMPACDAGSDPVAPAPVTAAPAPTAAAPTPPVTVPPSPLLLTCQADPRAGEVPLTVRFRSFPSGASGSYAFEWRFGDGESSTQPSPRHTYQTRGTFLATLLVASGDQTASCERSIAPGTQAAPVPSGPGPAPSPGATPIPDLVITILGNLGNVSFSPNPADARVGQRVIWHNADVMSHTATGAAFDTSFINACTDSAPITMTAAGTFPYRCLLHNTMTGTLRVAP